jgi:3-oxoacyl-[acyl-carrier-protein] synthase III
MNPTILADTDTDKARQATLIERLGIYLPSQAVSTAEVLAGCRRRILFPLERVTGIRSRRMAAEGESALVLARNAMADCFASSRHAPADIDLLISCSITRCDGPDTRFTYEPSASLLLRREFGMAHALGFDVSNACAGIFTAIYLIDALIQTGVIRRGMAVSGEYLTHTTRNAQRELSGPTDPRLASLTMGDAGAAVILERSDTPGAGFDAISALTLGKHSRYCIAKATDRDHGGAVLLTDPASISSVGVKYGALHAEKMLRERRWLADGVDHVILHQTSERVIQSGVRAIDETVGRAFRRATNVISNFAERGNTATTAQFLALYESIKKGTVKPGERLVFVISGSGQTVGTALYTLDDLPRRLTERGHAAAASPAPAPAATPQGARISLAARGPAVRVESTGLPAVAAVESGPHETDTLGWVAAAAEDCFARSSYHRNEVDLLLFAGVYRSEFLAEPAVAAMAAGDLKINDDLATLDGPQTFAFDIINGGVGFLNACHMAVQLIRARRHKVVMLTASEVENSPLDRPAGRLGVEETGSALILDEAPDGQSGFGAFSFTNYPEHAHRYSTFSGMLDGRFGLIVDRDSGIEEVYQDCIADAVARMLQEQGITLDDVPVILPPQISAGFLDGLARKLGRPRETFVDVTIPGKDRFTSSIVPGLRAAIDRGMARPGDLALVIAVGSGIQVGCALYRF